MSSRFRYRPKSPSEIANEQRAYAAAASQLSLLDQELRALEPCPFAFQFDYTTEDRKQHAATCDDWETSATFYKWERELGRESALAQMQQTFNVRYPHDGMVFAMGTHSRRPEQWLLVGVIRLDRVKQLSMEL